MTKDIIKQGFDAAEKEHQEKEVQKIKEIVQKHLEKIAYHHGQAKDHQEKERLLKKDLDDLKAGRLDKLEERHEKDEKAKEVRIIEVHRIEKEYVPMYPWRSPWQVQWVLPYYTPTIAVATGTGSTQLFNSLGTGGITSAYCTNIANATSSSLTVTGTNCQNFVGGSYQVNGQTINL